MPTTRGAHRPSKRLGQNFLTDQSIAEQIVSSISPGPKDTVLEPGPGHGVLTSLLQRRAGKVIAIEKDKILVEELRSRFSNLDNVMILEGDFLKPKEPLPFFNKLVSTPPYYLSSRLILMLAIKRFDVASLVFQKEFGERLLARPGTSHYGRLTVAAQRRLSVEKIRIIGRSAFSPRPKVDSTLLRLKPKEKGTELDEVLFEEMVRAIFSQRRRLAKSAMRHYLTKKYGRERGRGLVERITIPDLRVYQLSIHHLENLSLQLWRVLSDSLGLGNLDP